MINVAINGFGRIGRQVLQAGLNDKKINFVAINDLTDTKTLAHLLKYDSVHGIRDYKIKFDKKSITINNKKILVFTEKDPANLPWKKLKIDIVVESTGFFVNPDLAIKHCTAGAKKIIVSAPCKGKNVQTPFATLVKGVNDKSYKNEKVVSNASCTTNCLAPIVKVINDNFKIQHGLMTTVHAYTADQRIVDGPHKDLRRARAAAMNIVPTTTGAAIAVTKVIPSLKDKLDGMAIRVPVADGSLTDFTFTVKKNVTAEQINNAIKKAAKTSMKGIIQYSEEPLVSTDIIGNEHSAIFDALSTKVLDGKFVKVLAWYDNEWGYSKRIIDLIKLIK